ncbi:DUF1080 domain-containing protein [Algibacter sp. AS12]|uniref:3-keto-disaccharide hydrolase n=1 Tax=Algibacter sp. AS12 TaxID=3135773 RepID=UPI00398B3C7A
MRKPLLLTLIAFVLFSVNTTAQKKGKTISLFDENLTLFEKWNGVPHETIQGLPEGTYQSDNVHKGTALGLNNDLKNVFTIIKENNEPVLKITGEIYGGLTTKASYKNYHLSIYFKWGDKKWEPRLADLRDSGILYHAHGEHGSFWNTWKASLEYQVQETDLGDFIPLGGTTGKPQVEIRGTQATPRNKYNPNSDMYLEKIGYTSASKEPDAPHGEWNHLEIYVVGNDAVHLVNSEVVMVVENAKKKDGSILDQGQIQIQSEAAECYYKQFTLTGIKKFPKFIKKQVRFKKD